MSSTVTHVGFADESNWNTGRFRSLGMVTLSLSHLESIEGEVRRLLNESGVQEFKWRNLRGARERFAAEKLCAFAVDKASAGQLRVDVLVWDIEDSRHKIPKRDDTANLRRMYYHLFRSVLRKRWPDNAIWRLHPDEHTAMDWETLQDFLERKSVSIETNRSLFADNRFPFRLRRKFGIEEIRPVSSGGHPLLQIADLFAGLAVFSRDKYHEYNEWLQNNSGQRSLFDEANASSNPSRSSQERFTVLKQFDEACKRRSLGVSLKSSHGLRTPDPQNPINFWMYEVQHPEDKAPQKSGKSEFSFRSAPDERDA
jgi:hypothetical protein